jgi:hypothetical protein
MSDLKTLVLGVVTAKDTVIRRHLLSLHGVVLLNLGHKAPRLRASLRPQSTQARIARVFHALL